MKTFITLLLFSIPFCIHCQNNIIVFDDVSIQSTVDENYIYSEYTRCSEGNDILQTVSSSGEEALCIKFDRLEYNYKNNNAYIVGKVYECSTDQFIAGCEVLYAEKLDYDSVLRGYKVKIKDRCTVYNSFLFDFNQNIGDKDIIMVSFIGYFSKVYNLYELFNKQSILKEEYFINYLNNKVFTSIEKAKIYQEHIEILHLQKIDSVSLNDVPIFNNLKCIKINNSQLSSVPFAIEKLLLLEEIDLSYNKLHHFPTNVLSLKNVNKIFLSNNYLQSLPDDLSQMKYLKTLFIDKNRFDDIPKVIFKIKTLESLNIDSNNISRIPNDINRLSNLRILSLKGNRIPKNEINNFKRKNKHIIVIDSDHE